MGWQGSQKLTSPEPTSPEPTSPTPISPTKTDSPKQLLKLEPTSPKPKRRKRQKDEMKRLGIQQMRAEIDHVGTALWIEFTNKYYLGRLAGLTELHGVDSCVQGSLNRSKSKTKRVYLFTICSLFTLLKTEKHQHTSSSSCWRRAG